MKFTGFFVEESWNHEEPSYIINGETIVERHRGSTPLGELTAAAERLAGDGPFTWSFDHVNGRHFLHRA